MLGSPLHFLQPQVLIGISPEVSRQMEGIKISCGPHSQEFMAMCGGLTMLAQHIAVLIRIHDTQDVEAFRMFVNATVKDLELLHGLVKDADNDGRYVHFLKMSSCCSYTLLEHAILQTDSNHVRPFPNIDFMLRRTDFISAREAGDILLSWLPPATHH